MSRLASAAAAATGWPAKVKPCANIALPSMNGSAIRSEAIIAPIGAYAEVRRLRRGDDVRLVAIALAPEVVADPAPRADHLVGDQQHVVPIADLPHALEVAVLRRDAAAGVLNRLEDHRGDGLRALAEDPLLDRIRRPERIAARRPVVSLVFGTWTPPGARGSKGVLSEVRPVAARAPRVVP